MSRAKVRARAAAIRSELVRLSRDGWRNAKPCDYEPLETELRTLDQKPARPVPT